jgi:hypothetical protein
MASAVSFGSLSTSGGVTAFSGASSEIDTGGLHRTNVGSS